MNANKREFDYGLRKNFTEGNEPAVALRASKDKSSYGGQEVMKV